MNRTIAFSFVLSLACIGYTYADHTIRPITSVVDDKHDHDHKGVSLGVIKVDQYEIEVILEGNIEAGKEALFGLHVKGEKKPKAIRGWIGVENGRGSVKSKSHAHGDDIDIHIEVPSPIPADASLWLEVDTDEGKAKSSIALPK